MKPFSFIAPENIVSVFKKTFDVSVNGKPFSETHCITLGGLSVEETDLLVDELNENEVLLSPSFFYPCDGRRTYIYWADGKPVGIISVDLSFEYNEDEDDELFFVNLNGVFLLEHLRGFGLGKKFGKIVSEHIALAQFCHIQSLESFSYSSITVTVCADLESLEGEVFSIEFGNAFKPTSKYGKILKQLGIQSSLALDIGC